ncbi:hypothetical protein C8R44DRAFT_894044 [Mycena epipterygia]|nr:hypothetical protein C8R44DRAFT_894044 [Mycena epipterygia]
MPMPALLKKLSRKSLRKRTQSTTSPKSLDIIYEPPPPVSVSGGGMPTPQISSSPSFRISDNYFERPTSTTLTTPKTPGYSPPPSGHPPIGNTVPQDDFSKDLQAAWTSATTDPKTGKTDRVLQTLENGVADAMTKETRGAVIVAGIETGLNAVGGMEAIEKGLNSFMEGMPVLMNALDEVAKVHPFIAVAVLAFKAVWALEQKRRENDKKVLVLHMEMKEMMGVLTKLKNVKDADEIAPDGSTIRGRMQEIVKGTADDIKACANACDTYSKKKLVGKLVNFVGIFTRRRSEFEFALSIHTALGVDTANKTLSIVDQTTQELNAKIDMITKMFQQFVTPSQKEMSRMIEEEQKRGGQAWLDDKALQELIEFEAKSGEPARKSRKPFDLEDLKEDLQNDPDTAMERNLERFNRKFDAQTRQIIEEVGRLVKRDGDRVISAVTAGPHDRIIDPDVHIVWKEMGWRGSVKARHFVMALRDHFQEKRKTQRLEDKAADGQPQEQPTPAISMEDEWALEYISVIRLQQISEPFDDDASGFVTVAEANEFTKMRPMGWSLPHWIAYWSIGHHQAMTTYVSMITEILAKMFAIIPNIDPVNKTSVNNYLNTVYQRVQSFRASLNPCCVNAGLQEKFATYVTAEEARLRGRYRSRSQNSTPTGWSSAENLEGFQYDIDAPDTLELVTGPGRIDRFVLPLVYLLLERHFEIFRICQKSRQRTVHPYELEDAADTLGWVFDAVNTRVELLQSTFRQQKLDLKQQFKLFSHGLYECWNDPDRLWDAKAVQEAEYPEYPYEDSIEAQDIDISNILNYPVDEEPIDFAAYAGPENESQPDADALKALQAVEGVLGVQWNAHSYWQQDSLWPSAGMFSITLKPSSAEGDVQRFAGSSRANWADFKIAGECHASNESGKVRISFTLSFRLHSARFPTQYYVGVWDASADTITGTVGFDQDPATHDGVFVFKRMPPENMCFVPAPVELKIGKARAMWGFAIAAVIQGVRRAQWTWSFFKERRDNRRRFIELYIRSGSGTKQFGQSLTDLEAQDLARVKKSLTTQDSRFYHSLAEQRIRAMTDHGAYCDSCRARIGGARITCLVCQMKGTWNTVNFCELPGCITSRVNRDDMQKAHLPHHDLMKVRRVVHICEFGKIYRNAKEALQHARTFFKSSAEGAAVVKRADDSESEVDTEDEDGHAPMSPKRLSRIPTLAVSIPQTPIAPRGPASGQPMSAVSPSTQLPNSVACGPRCCGCSKPVTQPCWYCVQCAGPSFICWECDAKGEVRFGEHNFLSHDLVRVQELVVEKQLSIEERLTELDDRFERLEGQMATMEKLLEQLLTRVS